jgi:hypothetical protein
MSGVTARCQAPERESTREGEREKEIRVAAVE